MAVILGSFLLVLFMGFLNRHYSKRLMAVLMLAVFIFGAFEYTAFISRGSKLETFMGMEAALKCEVIEEPIIRENYTEYKVRSIEAAYGETYYNFKEKLLVRYRGSGHFKFGDLLQICGELTDISDKRNFGDFDYRLYYRSKGIYKVLKADTMSLLGENRQGLFASLAYKTRQALERIIYKALPDSEAAIMHGMLTGFKTAIDEDTMEDFKKTGIAHVLSVSGLHIGFLVLLLDYLLKPLKLNARLEGSIKLAVLVFYIAVIGFPAPAVRAVIMFSVMFAGKALGRDYDFKASISFAMLLLLLYNPLYIHDPGFIISFGCIYSIAVLYEAVNSRLSFIPVYMRETLSLSIAVWIGITPILALYFNYVSFISIVLNLAAVPLSFIITATGFAGVIAGSISDFLAVYVFSTGYYTIRLLALISKSTASLPVAGLNVPTLPFYLYIVYYMFTAFMVGGLGSLHYMRFKKQYLAGGCAVLIFSILLYSIPGRLVITHMDVGQGDSACIMTPSKKVVLIDGGGSTEGKYYFNAGKDITVPALLHQGVWSIDTIIISHPHDDHMEGIVEVLKSFKVKSLMLPDAVYDVKELSPSYGRILELCKKKNIQVFFLNKGDSIKLGSNIKIDILAPEVTNEEFENINNASIVAKLVYKDFELLFTGDIEGDAEVKLLDTDVNADILKVPHHGSKTSSTDAFIKAVRPVYAVVSVGRNNFGHPSEEVLERYTENGINVLRTDMNGAVRIITNGRNMRIYTVKR